jgi:predicted extracellular nuclease
MYLKFILILLLLLTNIQVTAQTYDTLSIAFWNVENLFDTFDDPNKQDEEFLPDGTKEWTNERFDDKLYKLSRIILAMNNYRGPDILGVCEVENEYVLTALVNKYLPEYKIAHSESPDNRGIDVALLYKEQLFELVSIKGDTVTLPDKYPTRLILNVKLKLTNNYKNEISFYVNHWPSRRGGEAESEKNRIAAALTLRKAIEDELKLNSNSKIVLMGDFNDEPTNRSIEESLNAKPLYCDSLKKETSMIIFNAAYQTKQIGIGSYKYRESWNLIDQIMLSQSLIFGTEVKYLCESFSVLKPELMTTKSGKFLGAPFPTYAGPRYLGGYSDHFPVEIKLLSKRN